MLLHSKTLYSAQKTLICDHFKKFYTNLRFDCEIVKLEENFKYI